MEFFSNPALVWFIIGIVLLVAEFLIPGLIILFFGVGACITALVTWLFAPSIDVQLIVFSAVSVISILMLRKYLKYILEKKKSTKQKPELENEYIGKIAIADIDFEPHHTGTVIFKGAPWQARSQDSIKKGDEVEIVEVDSITLIVKQIN